MLIRFVQTEDRSEWLRMRFVLWPDCSIAEHVGEVERYFCEPGSSAVAVAVRDDGGLAGFVEVGLRSFAEGCTTSPVGYIEGWYVDVDVRRTGIGSRLLEAAEAWTTKLGCREIASDCALDNAVSLAAHQSSGYAETGRIVCLRKALAARGDMP